MPLAGKALFHHCLRFDLFQGGGGEGSARIYGGALMASLLTTLLCVFLADQEPAMAIAVLFCGTGVLGFFGILSEVGAAFLDPRDADLLRALPVRGSTYLGARLATLAVIIAIRTASFGVVPAVVLSLGARGPWYGALSYLATLYLMFIALAGCAVLLFLALQKVFDPTWIREVLVWVQVLIYVVGTGGWLIVWNSDLAERLRKLTLIDWPGLPTNWFASLHLFLAYGDSPQGRHLVFLVGTLGAVAGLLFWLGRDYLDTLAELNKPSQRTRPPSQSLACRLFERILVPASQRAGFHLGRRLLRRERTFRLQTYPLLAYPLLFLYLGRNSENPELFAILFSHLSALYLPLVSLFLQFSDTPEASWVLDLHGMQRPADLWAGARKALVFGVVLPLGVLVTGLLCWIQGPFLGLSSGVFAMAVAALVAASGSVSSRPPFAERFHGALHREDAMGRAYAMFFTVAALGAAQIALLNKQPGALPLLAFLAVIFVGWRLRQPTPDPGPDDAPELTPAMTEAAATNEPFSVTLRRELRGLAVLYVVLAGFGWMVGSFV